MGRRRSLGVCYDLDGVDQGEVGLAGLGGKPGNGIAEIGWVEFGIFVDLARQEAGTEWAERYEADPKFF